MTNKNIFNAIRSVDEELILGASTSEKAPGAKRKILLKALTSAAAVILVISLSIGGAMMIGREDVEVPKDNNNSDETDRRSSVTFHDFTDFENYMNNPDEQYEYCRFSSDKYIDFDSIIPNSEITQITIGSNLYWALYGTNCEIQIEQIGDDIDSIKNKETLWKIIGYALEDGDINETPYDSIEIIETLKYEPQWRYTKFLWFKIDGCDIIYYYSNWNKEIIRVNLIVDGYNIHILWPVWRKELDSNMEAFYKALNPSFGATDDSVIEMLDKIKALIPTGDEANGAQINASADASFELGSTNPIDTPSSDDSGNSEQTAGETVADTDVTDTPVNEEEEEYLYPEDYEFPVIPGISPDWKPNRNGKYPLKDGYTREELTLILACAIELDFGDMTFEEMSQVEFRLIEETEEPEE